MLVPDFNSTMVRLKEYNTPAAQKERYLFQFHYGTIKSSSTGSISFNSQGFQFHYGTIKSLKGSWLSG